MVDTKSNAFKAVALSERSFPMLTELLVLVKVHLLSCISFAGIGNSVETTSLSKATLTQTKRWCRSDLFSRAFFKIWRMFNGGFTRLKTTLTRSNQFVAGDLRLSDITLDRILYAILKRLNAGEDGGSPSN